MIRYSAYLWYWSVLYGWLWKVFSFLHMNRVAEYYGNLHDEVFSDGHEAYLQECSEGLHRQ